MESKHSPIIIAGMHRSGTSMVTRLLDACGLIIGNKLDSNHESIFFQRINIWMMSLLGSSWDNPKSFNEIDSQIKNDIVKQLDNLLNSRTNSLYFGWTSFLRKGSFNEISSAWGWKDPRNTFTIPLWEEVFPALKVIYIIRHPLDVASSLYIRQQKEIQRDINREKTYSSIAKAILSINHTNYNSSLLINNYDDCFKIIERYYDEILKQSQPNSITVKFEDILSEPKKEIKNILNFCEIKLSEEQLLKIINSIDDTRMYAYRKNNALLEYTDKYKNLISKMGY